MGLANAIARRAVSLGKDQDGGDIVLVLRGLTPHDIKALLAEDGGKVFADLYQMVTSNAVSQEAVGEAALKMLGELPDLLAKIIARANDDPDNWELALGIPIGPQYEALEAITEMTFTSEKAIKKIIQAVRPHLGGVLESPSAPANHPTTSTPGSGD